MMDLTQIFPDCLVGSRFLSFHCHTVVMLVSIPTFSGFGVKIIITLVLNNLKRYSNWDSI